MQWNVGTKFSFFNKNSTLVFKKYANMRPQLTYFRCDLKLMLKLFPPHFKWRWQIYNAICIWEIRFEMFDSLTVINSVYLQICFQCLMTNLLGSTYMCTYLLKIKVVENKSRNWTGQGRSKSCLRVATSQTVLISRTWTLKRKGKASHWRHFLQNKTLIHNKLD
jgi:hypothetical protein